MMSKNVHNLHKGRGPNGHRIRYIVEIINAYKFKSCIRFHSKVMAGELIWVTGWLCRQRNLGTLMYRMHNRSSQVMAAKV